jgi:hypothetical protein
MRKNNDGLVQAFRLSGLTQEAFCKERGVALERLRYHLYKKNRTKTATKSTQANRKIPAFISFKEKQPQYQSSVEPSYFTIIHGSFTLKQLSLLLKEMNR